MSRLFFIYSYFFILSNLFPTSKENYPIWNYLTPIEVKQFNTGLNLIDCIYVLNLDARTEKWQNTKNACEEYNLGINRVSAINGWKLPKKIQRKLASPYPIKLPPGALGCLLTHISILKDAYDRNFSIIWVMEDDIEFLEDPKQIMDFLATLFTIDPNWDIFYTDTDYRNKDGYTFSLALDPRPPQTLDRIKRYLTYDNCHKDILQIIRTDKFFSTFFSKPEVNKVLKYCLPSPIWNNLDPRLRQKLHSLDHYLNRDYCHKDIMRIRSRYGTHSMIISKKGVKKILDYYTSRPVWAPIDIETHYIPGIREYSCTRDIVSNSIGAISDTVKSNL